MKRLHNKRVSLPPRILRQTLQGFRSDGLPLWLYTNKDLTHYNNVFCSKIEMIDLPFLDVYELKAESTKGITVGYCFDSFARNKAYAFNYLCAYSSDFTSLKLKDLKETSSLLQLRYKLRNVFLYSLGSYGSLITVGYSQTIKEKLEF